MNDYEISEFEFIDEKQARMVPARFVKLKKYTMDFSCRGKNLAEFIVIDAEGVYHDEVELFSWNVPEYAAVNFLKDKFFSIYKND